MAVLVTVEEIHKQGYEWPKYSMLEEYMVFKQGKIDLSSSLENLRSSQAYYKKQLADAFNFKMQHGADYSDFTDKHDDYARMDHNLREAIAYLEEIRQAFEQTS